MILHALHPLPTMRRGQVLLNDSAYTYGLHQPNLISLFNLLEG